MKIITITIASLFLALNVLLATAGDVTYVGGGRYTCSGSGCGEFNAAQASRNSVSEKLDDLRTEDKIRRMRELSQINAERLERGERPLDTSAGVKTRGQIIEESDKRHDEDEAKLRARKECERETLGTFGACDHLESKYVPAPGEHETSYAHAEQVSRKCEAAGKLGEKAFKYKRKGMRAAETIAMADKMSKFNRNYFLDGAISESEQDAYMKAWADCMDDNN